MELQGASTIPKASLGLLSTHSSIRIARHTDYSNLCHTIACTLALYDEQKSVQKQKQHVDYLLSLKCDLLMRQNRCVNQLAKALCGVDLSPLAALHNAPVPVHNAIVLPKKKRLVSALKFPTRESTFILREVGLTDEVLEALALYFGYHKEGQLTAIADEVASLQLLWYDIPFNLLVLLYFFLIPLCFQ
ncbi:hypothetical protein EON65_12970 [archaeon]|nr:MAG: hypothetical protein EON65_12970 [archaeon]